MIILTGSECLSHDAGFGFPESPARLERILSELASDSEVESVESHSAFDGVVERVHDSRYLAIFRRAVERGDGLLGSSDNPLTRETYRSARSAAVTSLEGVDRMMMGEPQPVFAAVRPPGHHAESNLAMGFCYLNNAAMAAEHLVVNHGADRICVYDFDVHHGNGTQQIFYERADVLYASTHQWPFYPGTGAVSETGQGEGLGKTVNVPLEVDISDKEFLGAVRESVLPAVEGYQPDALVVSAGFDPWVNDPMGGWAVSEDGFFELGKLLGAFAGKSCGGRVLSILEGGYDLEALGRLVRRYLEGLEEGLGVRSEGDLTGVG